MELFMELKDKNNKKKKNPRYMYHKAAHVPSSWLCRFQSTKPSNSKVSPPVKENIVAGEPQGISAPRHSGDLVDSGV